MEDRRTRAVLPAWWGHSTSADYAERVWTAEESGDPVLGIFLLYSTLCIIPSQREWWHLVSLLYNSLRFLLRDRALQISLYTLPLEQWFQALSWEEAHQGRGSWQVYGQSAPGTRHRVCHWIGLGAGARSGGRSSSSCRPFEPCWTTGSTSPGASGIGARWMCQLGWGAAAICLLQDGIAVLEGAEVVVRGIVEEEEDEEEEAEGHEGPVGPP